MIIDLRPTSSTYKKWESIVLSQDEYCWRYIPKGCANGIQTLDDDTELIYQSSQYYSPEHERGIRWDDPSFQIKWLLPVKNISDTAPASNPFDINLYDPVTVPLANV